MRMTGINDVHRLPSFRMSMVLKSSRSCRILLLFVLLCAFRDHVFHILVSDEADEDAARDFFTQPVTAEESNRLLLAEQKRRGPSATPLHVAVCHPTIFISETASEELKATFLRRYFMFVSYYRLLGVEQIFMWYEPLVEELPDFEKLDALPYVTLTEYRAAPREYHGQQVVEELCLNDERFAASFDWVLSIDADEFLWLAPMRVENHGGADSLQGANHESETSVVLHRYQTLPEFLDSYHSKGFSYLSIGKVMYSTLHVDDRYFNQSKNTYNPFGLQTYPYTPGPYCLERGHAGDAVCPTWVGRCKILVRPSHHGKVNVHGTVGHKAEDGTHLHAHNQAHLKEWNKLLNPPPSIHHDNDAHFYASRMEEVMTYNTMKASAKNEQGQVKIHHDGLELKEWFDYLAGKLGGLHTS